MKNDEPNNLTDGQKRLYSFIAFVLGAVWIVLLFYGVLGLILDLILSFILFKVVNIVKVKKNRLAINANNLTEEQKYSHGFYAFVLSIVWVKVAFSLVFYGILGKICWLVLSFLIIKKASIGLKAKKKLLSLLHLLYIVEV